MSIFSNKKIVAAALVAALVGAAILVVVLVQRFGSEPVPVIEQTKLEPQYSVIGASVEGRDIVAHTFESGPANEKDTHLVFVGGMHGGYEWNSVLLAYEAIDYFNKYEDLIPHNVTVTIIPAANPDGVYAVIGKEGRFTRQDVPLNTEVTIPGRFNANSVDLNRNFDCKWKPESTWRGNTVSAGTEPFSEPEAKAIRDFVLKSNPTAVIFWHSQANAVYASECENGIIAETIDIMNAYASAAGYQAFDSFDAYEISGDAEGWLASISIPALTVELKTHETIEWEQNIAGVKALFERYGK